MWCLIVSIPDICPLSYSEFALFLTLSLTSTKIDVLKNPTWIFSPKNFHGKTSTRGKIKHCYYWSIFIFTHHMHEILSYLNKKLILKFIKKSPRENSPDEDFDLCHGIFSRSLQILKVRKREKISKRYNQAPHLTKDTNGKVTISQLDIKNNSQEVSPFQAGDHNKQMRTKA